MDGQVKVQKKMKTAFQLRVLEKTYAGEQWPSEELRGELSKQLGLSDRQLQMWFCNRRLKEKNTPRRSKNLISSRRGVGEGLGGNEVGGSGGSSLRGVSRSGSDAMEKAGGFNLKVGQLAEMKTFEEGFRGAWFRCKVKDIDLKKNKIKLEYYDFEEEIQWTKIYEAPPHARKSSLKKKQLMLRPQYPLLYHKSEVPPVNSISEICVVIDGAWKVGDMVDWDKDDCFWSARIIEVLSDDKVQLQLPMPPAGEGSDDILIAFCKDLRPSLEWSQRKGWALPTMDGETASGAQLIFPSMKGMTSQREEVEHAAAAGDDSPLNASSTTGTGTGMGISVNSSVERQISEPMDIAVFEDVKTDDMESTDSISSMHVQESRAAAAAEEDVDYSVDLNITHEDTLEAPLLDLEELANKIKWIKSILHSHRPPSNDGTCWKFSS